MAENDIEPQEEVEPTRQVAAQKPAEPKARPHPQRLLALAQELGLEEPEAYTLPDLIGALNVLQGQQQKVAQPAVVPEKEPEIEWGTRDGKPLTEEDWAPEMAAKIRRDHQRWLDLDKKERDKERAYEERFKAYEEREKKREEREHNQEKERIFDQMDKLFASKPKLFGKSGRNDLDAESPQYKRRQHIAQLMTTLKGSLQQVFKEACEIVYGEPQDASEEPEIDEEAPTIQRAPRRPTIDVEHEPHHEEVVVAAKERRWASNGGVANPSHRKSPEIDDDTLQARTKKAEKAVRSKLREKGYHAPDSGPDDSDLLPS